MNILSSMVGYIAAVAAVVLFGIQVVAQIITEAKRQKTLAAEAKNREDELRIQKQQLELTIAREMQIRTSFEQQMTQLQASSVPLANQIAAELTRRTDWAAKALEEAKLHPSSQTLIANRMRHYPREKERLGDSFTPLIVERCKRFAGEGFHVVLLVDSGSTLLPHIDAICRAVNQRRDEPWLASRGLSIFTNSLAGAAIFMQLAPGSSDDQSDLSVDFHMLPGVPLPTFAGVAGTETLTALASIRQSRQPKQVKIIALLTGNWVQVTLDNGAIPLVRGTGHFDVKQQALQIADETFVIAPLGKIFFAHGLGKIVAALQELGHSNSGARNYDGLDLGKIDRKTIKLVTTYRPSSGSREFLLRALSESMFEKMNGARSSNRLTRGIDRAEFAAADIRDLPSLAFPFSEVGIDLHEQLKTEFPHSDTRNAKFIETFFAVPHHLTEQCF